jgi:hypothetical protein
MQATAEPTERKKRRDRDKNKEENLNKEYDPEELLLCSRCKGKLARKHFVKACREVRGCLHNCIDCAWTQRLIHHIKINNKTSKKDKQLLITKEEVDSLTRQPCRYCGRYSNENFKRNGLDRIDSSKPYTLDNVVPCCTFCNQAKNVHLREYFLLSIGAIYYENRLEIESLLNPLQTPVTL